MDPQLPEPEPLVSLIEALRRLPGVGVRSARRMAYHLMQHDLQGADMLGRALAGAVQNLRHCARCNSSPKTRSAPPAPIPSAIPRCCASSRRRRTRT